MIETQGSKPFAVDFVSIVIPVYEEEKSLDELVRRCLEVGKSLRQDFELVLVDDGSRDCSREKIRGFAAAHPEHVKGVLLNRNYGQHAAILAGFSESKGDTLITLDADLQNPPEAIPALILEVEKGHDVVGTVRVPRCDSFFRTVCSRFINTVARRVTGVAMHDYGCMLRAYRRNVIDAVLKCQDFTPFIPILANSFASNTTEIEVSHAERKEGNSKYNLWKLISLQFDLLTGMTTLPLRVLSVLGVVLSMTGVGFGVFLLLMRLAIGAHWAAEGVFTLFAGLFMFTGLQFFALGILGEYLARIALEVRARPRYLISERVGAGCPGSVAQVDFPNTQRSVG